MDLLQSKPLYFCLILQKGLRILCIRAPQLKINFHGSGDGGKASQNDPLRLGPGSFGSKLMDHDGLKVSHFQLKI